MWAGGARSVTGNAFPATSVSCSSSGWQTAVPEPRSTVPARLAGASPVLFQEPERHELEFCSRA